MSGGLQDYGQGVLDFASDMARGLSANAHKTGWWFVTPRWLLRRLRSETRELANAMRANDREATIREAADVANYAMMIADHARIGNELAGDE